MQFSLAVAKLFEFEHDSSLVFFRLDQSCLRLRLVLGLVDNVLAFRRD
jgi:hypothetical protein